MTVDMIPLVNTTGATLRIAGNIVPRKKDKTTEVNSADQIISVISMGSPTTGAMWIIITIGDTVGLIVKANT